MKLFISHMSAMRFWSTCTAASDLEIPSTTCVLDHCVHNLSQLKEHSLSHQAICAIDSPLHVLVNGPAKRRATGEMVCHSRSSALPAGSLVELAPDAFVVSPEMCFLEMATVLPFAILIEFGCLLCGTYRSAPRGTLPAVPIYDLQPLCTKRKLEGFLKRATCENGVAIARKALPYICEGSASPYETKLFLMLCLPRHYGGYGFAPAQLNHRISFNEREQMLYRRSFVVLDLFWSQHGFAIEYDGALHHSREADVVRDRQKDSELRCRGITVIRVDKYQLSSLDSMYVVAKKVAKLTGMRLRKSTEAQLRKREELYRLLFRNRLR